jgi:hypothetical protein
MDTILNILSWPYLVPTILLLVLVGIAYFFINDAVDNRHGTRRKYRKAARVVSYHDFKG